uniref:protein-serine/threonine phosphatase n=1 Tax=Anolis carolinensis TaxID=28377 RepID=A0A803SWP4_ANOCA
MITLCFVLSLRQVIQYQTVRYDILPLSKVSRERLNQVKRKILVLDLDETLIHSHHDGVLRPTVRPGTPPDFILKVVIDKHPVRFFVHKRPHVDFFLEVVSQWYELVVFTASMEIYGSAVADKLDNNRSILKRRYYRQHCTLELGSYIKDLSVVHTDLSSIVILDNSPGAYRSHPGSQRTSGRCSAGTCTNIAFGDGGFSFLQDVAHHLCLILPPRTPARPLCARLNCRPDSTGEEVWTQPAGKRGATRPEDNVSWVAPDPVSGLCLSARPSPWRGLKQGVAWLGEGSLLSKKGD